MQYTYQKEINISIVNIVKGIPDTADFSLKYTPSPVTLFRYSSLMFNAHHIHLDKEYCQKEGYPGMQEQ